MTECHVQSQHPRNNRIENRLEELGIKVFRDLLDNNQPHVVDAGIDWCHGFMNNPTLHLRVAADTYRETFHSANESGINRPMVYAGLSTSG